MRAWFVNERGERAAVVRVLSHDGAALDDAVAQAADEMRGDRKFRLHNVASNAALDRPEIRIVPRARRGWPSSASPRRRIAETIRVATIGDIDANLAKFNVGDRQIPIRVQIDEGCARRHGAA